MKNVLPILVAAILPHYCVAQFVGNPYLFPTGAGGGPVSIDTSSKNGGDTSISTIYVYITVASNTNRVLYVFCGAGDAGSRIPSSVASNYDGAFTYIGSADESVWVGMSVYRLINPTVATHTITVNYSELIDQVEAFAISLYGVDQTTPNGTIGTVTGATGTSPSASATVTSGGLLIGAIASDSGASLSVTTGTSLQTTLNVASDTSYNAAYNTGTGSVSLQWSQNSDRHAAVVVPVNGD